MLVQLTLAFAFAARAAAESSCASNSSSAPDFKNWFAFGDSYTATSFDYMAAQPSAANPIGNPAFPGNTICGAVPNWLAYTITKYNASLELAYDFASSGATINTSLVPTFWPWIVPVTDQVSQFQSKYAGGSGGWTSEDAVFAVWIGINDIGNSYALNSSRTAFNDALMTAYFDQTTRLYAAGARNFVFFNVPPIDRSPLMVGEGVSALVQPIVADYNAKLAQGVANWTRANSGTAAWLIDAHALLTSILDDPASSGFKDATSYGDGAGVIWCNDFHLSPPVHDLIARNVQSTLASTASAGSPETTSCPQGGSARGGVRRRRDVMLASVTAAITACIVT